MSPISAYFAPVTVEEAVGILEEGAASTRIVAGGTDVMVRLRRGLVPDAETALLSLHRIDAIRGVQRVGNRLEVGAATTAADLIRDPVIAEHAPILATVADRLASAQIRTRATIGGNLANASPAGDLINPLLLLDAEIDLVSGGGTRTVAVDAFFRGPGESVIAPGEIITRITFALPPPARVFGFEKAGTRPAMECSVVTVGLAYTPGDDGLTDVRVAFGSSAPTPLRGRATEAVLEGATLSGEMVTAAVRAARNEVSPISDIRGTAGYRRVLVGEFVRRLLDVGND